MIVQATVPQLRVGDEVYNIENPRVGLLDLTHRRLPTNSDRRANIAERH
jgi:hypothetical protein